MTTNAADFDEDDGPPPEIAKRACDEILLALPSGCSATVRLGRLRDGEYAVGLSAHVAQLDWGITLPMSSARGKFPSLDPACMAGFRLLFKTLHERLSGQPALQEACDEAIRTRYTRIFGKPFNSVDDGGAVPSPKPHRPVAGAKPAQAKKPKAKRPAAKAPQPAPSARPALSADELRRLRDDDDFEL